MRNRKHLARLSKKCMTAILIAVMIMSSVAGAVAFPVDSYAQEYTTSAEIEESDVDYKKEVTSDDSLGEVLKDDTIFYNNGSIDINNGTVGYNYSELNNNYSEVVCNGFDRDDTSPVKLENNYGTVGINYATITNNFGTVDENEGTVVNNYDGIIQSNKGTVTNQYWIVGVEPGNTVVAYGSGITTQKVNDSDYHYVKQGESGTVTLTPADGYKIDGSTGVDLNGKDSDGGGFTYSAAKDANGVWTVTLTGVSRSLLLNPEYLSLIVEEIIPEENSGANVIVNDNDEDSKPQLVDNDGIDTSYYEVLLMGSRTTVEALQQQVVSGDYASIQDALYQGNITEPAEVKEAGEASAWVSALAEKEAIVGGNAVKITEKPKALTKAMQSSVKNFAKEHGQKVLNCGRIKLDKFFTDNAGKDVTYPLLLDAGKYQYKEGDHFYLYNNKTGKWDEFPTTGFRTGHYDIKATAGTDMSAYFDAKTGNLNYYVGRQK